MNSRRRALTFLLAGILVLLLAGRKALPSNAGGLSTSPPNPVAQGTSLPTPSPNQDRRTVNESIGTDTCLSCHNNPNLTLTLENGDLFSLFVPPEIYDHSIHGEKGYACVQCHTSVGNYPHPPFSATDARDVSLQLNKVCQRCHSSKFALTQDSVHAAAQASGNRNAAVCTDCHTAHAVKQLTDPQTQELLPDSRQWIPQTCARCHYAIYQKYSTSVHGAALLAEGNPDVPTCIDCHGVHNIENPTTAAFRLKSPEICANCHTNPSIMNKYGISTQVLNTYVADFHGTTVAIFEKQSPDQETNKAVCFDCHGVHDIKRVDDPVEGLRIKENLLARCQVCHPEASANFPTAWLSHYIPSPDRNPLVYFVNLFYKFFIPTLLGGMGILVVLDAGAFLRKLYRKTRRGRVGALPQPQSQPEKPATPALPATQNPYLNPESGSNMVKEDLDSPNGTSSPANASKPREAPEESPNG